MASWNPQPTFPVPNWQGNTQLITKQQLVSTVASIDTRNFSTLNISTLTVPQWISTPLLYVSDIQGAAIDISGITITKDGMFNAPIISVSSLNLKGDLGIDVSFDLGLGKALGGLFAGLGALFGGAAIGVGTGAGLAISGAEQGIATLIAGRPQNYINNNVYETINFTSQLQVSTLGNAYPLYSTIFRTVSSPSVNTVPGPEIFVSSFFQPGQICIRTVSDPFQLITSSPTLNTSTLQGFSQWVPLAGLEPENIVADTVQTNFLSSGTAFLADFTGISSAVQNMVTQNVYVVDSNPGNPASVNIGYTTPLNFQLGAVNYAALQGNINYFWIQSDQDILFGPRGDPMTSPWGAQLSLGTNQWESILQVSSIYSRGNIQANTAYFSSLTVENLLVISTFSTVINQTSLDVLSTSIVTAGFIGANSGYISALQVSSLTNFNFNTRLGNPLGIFDITKVDTVVSTTYNQISSLQQNILSYSLSALVNDEATFNALTPQAEIYTVSPQNAAQWASTMLICNPGADIGGQVAMTWSTTWTQAGITSGYFDMTVDMRTQAFSMNAVQYAAESPGGGYIQNFFYTPPTPNYLNTYRFTLAPTGLWSATTPAPPPAVTSNNNTFTIFQDINDTYITATDRLHLRGGDILLEGNISLAGGQLDTLNVDTAYLTSTFAINIQVSTLNSRQLTNNYNFTGGYNDSQISQPLNFTYNVNSTDFLTVRSLNLNSRGPNMFNSMNLGEWANTIFTNPLGVTTTNTPAIYLGELTKTFGFQYGLTNFWINNTNLSPPISYPVYVVKQPGSWLSTLGFASPSGTGFTRITTPDGVNWSLTSNVPNPGGAAVINFSNNYQLLMNQAQTQLNVGMPFLENVSGTKTIQANKIVLAANQLRTISYASPSFPPRECGLEFSSYFDANVIFTGTQSDAVNIIPSPQGNLAYAVVAWNPTIVCGRMRTASLGIQGFEFEPVVVAFSGTFGDVVWASHRYINVNGPSPEANIREVYFMCPQNWTTSENLIGPY